MSFPCLIHERTVSSDTPSISTISCTRKYFGNTPLLPCLRYYILPLTVGAIWYQFQNRYARLLTILTVSGYICAKRVFSSQFHLPTALCQQNEPIHHSLLPSTGT